MRVLGFVLLVVLLASCGPRDSIQDAAAQIGAETTALGAVLVFPEGWTPVMFSSVGEGYKGRPSGYVFVCVRDGVYRLCTPRLYAEAETE